MISTKNKFIFGAILFLLVSSNIFAQDATYQIERELDEILLKKDLLEVIKDAEKSPQNDVPTLYRRLILYHRAVNFEKASQIIKQLPQAQKLNKKSFYGGSVIKNVLEDTLFRDKETIKFYLQTYYLDNDLFKKFTKLCLENASDCDVYGFDIWLGQKVSENENSDYEYERWFGHRLQWRESFGLDKNELLNKFVNDFRNDPNNLVFALRYLGYFPKLQTVEEIAEKFNSKQAYDYYALGNRMINYGWYSSENADNIKIINKHAIIFLNKSLEIPFNEEDSVLMYKNTISAASYQPKKINHKKQFQYWAKTKLAETYTKVGEANKAQPIAEELAKMDKSDIETGNTEFLAGMVQAASGARVVEKKILSERTKRENTADYWIERANYYRGRNELKLVFDAYLEGLKTVSFDLKNEVSMQNRGSLIWSLASFASDFGKYAEDLKEDGADKLSIEQKLKAEIWLETEKLLEKEFNGNKTNLSHSYSLLREIKRNDFDDLFAKIINQNTEVVNSIFREMPSNNYYYSDLFNDIWESEKITQAKKDEFLLQLFNIAQTSDLEKAVDLAEIINYRSDKFAVQLVPVLNRNLAKVEEKLKLKNLSFNEREELEDLKNDYLKLTFSNYLLAKDWQSAERFMSESFDWSKEYSYDRHESINRLAKTAAENSDYANAVRLWKMRSNLDQRNLKGLEILSLYYEIGLELVDFYEQMKVEEPYSPIPDMALKILKSTKPKFAEKHK